VKTCADVQREINELRKKLKRDKREFDVLKTYRHLSEQQRCDSESPFIKCEKCDCWKFAKEYSS